MKYGSTDLGCCFKLNVRKLAAMTPEVQHFRVLALKTDLNEVESWLYSPFFRYHSLRFLY
jgi:hypothetical protein